MARWFHWAPFRALIIIKKEDLDQCDLMGFQPDDFNIDIHDDYTGQRYTVHRPADVDTAFDMQRHFQWDIYLSTPNIAKVKDFIREVAETAYRHKSLSGKLPKPLAIAFGFHNAWYEFQHDPENNGKLTSHINGKPRKYKADERIFNCYQSTATGEHTDSKADQSIFGDPKVKFLLVVVVLSLVSLVYFGLRFSTLHSDPEPVKTDTQTVPQANPQNIYPPANTPSQSVHALAGNTPNHVPPEQSPGFFNNLGFNLLQAAYHDTQDKDHQRLAFLADTPDGLISVPFQRLFQLGVRASIHGLCNIKLYSPDGSVLSLNCFSKQIRECLSSADSPSLAIRRDCFKYGQPKPKREIPKNALVTAATSIIPPVDLGVKTPPP